jgi:hypothetical protein
MDSNHFKLGEKVKIAHEPPAVIEAILTCKCHKAEQSLLLRMEDGRMRVVVPIALNHHND